jgi:hypothetical protein
MSKQHTLYPAGNFAALAFTSFVYRGCRVEVRLQPAPVQGTPDDCLVRKSHRATFKRWFYFDGVGTPSLPATLDFIDYKLSGMREQTEKLVAMKPGGMYTSRLLKVESLEREDGRAEFFVDVITGKFVHAGDIAAQICGYKPRVS